VTAADGATAFTLCPLALVEGALVERGLSSLEWCEVDLKALAAVPDSLLSQPVAAWAVVAALLVAELTAVLELLSRYVTAMAADEGPDDGAEAGALSSGRGAESWPLFTLVWADSNSFASLFLRAGFMPDSSAAADRAEAVR
jgi:hypothetical protein